MLRHIRALVYKMGFRPKPNTILFSPSLDFVVGTRDAAKTISTANHEAWKSMVNVMKKAEATGTIDLGILPPITVTTRRTLYERMQYCVLCRAKLEAVVLDIKECPHGCGSVFTTENSEGLPIITFEPAEKENR